LLPDERLRIDTPEQVALELPVAGIGSRFLALTLDTLLQILLVIFVGLALLLMQRALGSTGLAPVEWVATLGASVSILFGFCVYWGYFAGFEIAWSGQTPGKRLAGIRVIKESGRPISAYEAIGRNVLRAIDFLPVLYGVGLVAMMLNRHSRRIGDFVAGTIVVYDRHAAGFEPAWPEPAGGTAANASLMRVTAEELRLIETYLQRRSDLDPMVRDEMAGQIASRIRQTTGITPEPGQTVDEFLALTARRVRDVARFRRY
jgi:uncharacterized RDD family membrane protein YckC